VRVAALYDVHGNLPALEAVLDEVRALGVDRIVVGGDVVPGPMPRETLERLLRLEPNAEFIHGNCELAVLALIAAGDPDAVTYWGTTSGRPLPEPHRGAMIWSAQEVRGYAPVLARWPKTLEMRIDGLGTVLFCHGTPRSETEIVTRESAETRLLPLFDGLGADVVVCGHTHMAYDRRVGRTRVVNAGSVGSPFGEPGAHWALLGPTVELRRTTYDLAAAAARVRATAHPSADQEAGSILEPRSEAEMLELYRAAEPAAILPQEGS
jgi:predicted phosphodiesterase